MWNLFAAPEFSVEPKRWCFPFVGCLSYKGYFDEAKARAAGADLARDGYDVYVGGVAAYSTLGHFDDPFLSSMLRLDEAVTAGIVFHELAHQRVYVRDDTELNEAFASLVEEEGVRRWYARKELPGAIEKFNAARKRRRDVAALMVDARNRLADITARTPDAAAARAQKSAELARLAEALTAGGQPAPGELNNARLIAVATYERCVPALRAELERLANDLPAFYSEMKRLENDSSARRRLCPTT